MNNLIHWWKLPLECPIKIDNLYTKNIIKSCSNNPYVKRRTLENIKYGIKNPRVKTVKKVLNSLNIKLKDIEDKITHIQTSNRLISIKFPIKESPLHVQILSHGIFDGSKEKNACIRYKVRHDIETKKMFKDLLIKTFGKNCYGHTDNCYFMFKSLSELLASHYEIREFKSKKAVLSKKLLVLSRNQSFRRAILKAAFIDEGYCKYAPHRGEKFRLTLVSGIKNEKLAKQLKYLTDLEGYRTSLYKARNNTEFTIPILTKSKKDFYNNIIKSLPKNHRKQIEAEKAVLTKTF